MMNLTLLAKELVGLRLSIGLVLAIHAIDLTYRCMFGFLDRPEPSGSDSSDGSDSVFSIVILSLLSGVVIGTAMIGQEREHQTLTFLDGLPVSRLSIFIHKALAALMVVLLLEGFSITYDWFFLWLNQDSLSEPIDFRELFAGFVVRTLLTTCVVGGAAFLSFSRKWFPLLLGIVVSLLVWVRTRGGPLSTWLDTSALLLPSVVEGQVVWPVQQMVGHAILGTFGWIFAARAFLHRDGRLTLAIERYADLPVAGYLTAVGYVLAAMVWIGLLFSLANDDEEEVSDRPAVTRAAGEVASTLSDLEQTPPQVDAFGGLQTESFQVIYRRSALARVSTLAASMDAIHEEVMDYFENPDRVSGKIVVDTGALIPSHAAGVTNWTKVRVPLNQEQSNAEFFRTLRHEVGHVYIERISDGQATTHFNAMRVFHEGVATAVELFSEDEETGLEREKVERWAAAVDSRGRIPFPVLCDNETLLRTRDDSVVYPLGYLVADSLVEIGGQSLPRRMMEKLRVLSLPAGSRPSQVWSTLLQQNGTSLEMLTAAYESRLKALRERESVFLEGIPRIQSELTIESDEIVIRAEPVDRADNTAELICRVEMKNVITNELEPVARAADGTFRLPRERISGSRIRFLVGWWTPEVGYPVFEPWVEEKLKER
ncbi:MAG: hypothetical protein MUF23_02335 [Pirellula sp.]|jgi:hypothetical protein|nr:hypothetical protein [Pirellula sp.]